MVNYDLTEYECFISGTSSGLGSFLLKKFSGNAIARDVKVKDHSGPSKRERIIVHTAFNSSKHFKAKDLYQHAADNIFLTKRLLSLPHDRFVFISTIEVYPLGNAIKLEDEEIDVSAVMNLYGHSKLVCESLVNKYGSGALILRAGLLVGSGMRANNFTRLMGDGDAKLSLSASSKFYICHYDFLSEFIAFCCNTNVRGTFNFVPSDSITLKQLASNYYRQCEFGDFIYDSGSVSNNKIVGIDSRFNFSSYDSVNKYIENLGGI